MTVIKVDPRDLDPSPLQPRRDTLDVGELAASIQENGLLHLPIVRAGLGGRKEIVIGHRRVAACVLLGFEEIEVRYLVVCDEESVRIIQAAENAVRTDLHPLDEAQSYSELLDLLGTVEAISENVGIQALTIRKRLSLLNLSQEWRDYWRLDNAVTLGAALAVAALGSEDQSAVFGEYVTPTIDKVWGTAHELRLTPGPKITEVLVREWLRRKDEKLRHAPFDIEDSSLPGGACSACPKRASTQRDLFGALDYDRCLDRACWRSKIKVVNARMLERLGKIEPVKVPAVERFHWLDLDIDDIRARVTELEAESGLRAERQVVSLPGRDQYTEAISQAEYARIKDAAADARIKDARSKPSEVTTGAATSDPEVSRSPMFLQNTVIRDYRWVAQALANKDFNPTPRDLLLTTLAIMIPNYRADDLDRMNLREQFEEVFVAEDSGNEGREVMRIQFADFLNIRDQGYFEEDDAKVIDRLLDHLGLKAPATAEGEELGEDD